MAITFPQLKKSQRYLILALIILVILVVIWKFFLLEKPQPEITKPAKLPKIDFGVLKSPILEALRPFEEIPPFEEKSGRKNPFTPY